jgi:FkbM family methyltransferase
MAFSLSFYNVGLKQIQSLSRSGEKVIFENSENRIFVKQLSQFEFSLNQLIKLLQNKKVHVIESFPDKFVVMIEGLSFHVSSLSNMAVLFEVFIEQIYAVDLIPENLLVLDIGMNVGVASQYFASKSQVKAVFGYEPFIETYQEAIANLELNSSIKHKVFCNNYGVSNVTETRTLSFFESGLLSASTISDSNNSYGRDTSKKIQVQLKSIREIFDELYPQYPDSPVLLKIDCEGEEYAIFESLKDTSYLDKVVCILVEWHEKGYDPIVAVLKQHDFQMLHLPHESENCGMIYGFRK